MKTRRYPKVEQSQGHGGAGASQSVLRNGSAGVSRVPIREPPRPSDRFASRGCVLRAEGPAHTSLGQRPSSFGSVCVAGLRTSGRRPDPYQPGATPQGTDASTYRGLKARPIPAWGNAPGPRPPTTQGPKARPIPAWGNAPGPRPPTTQGPKARPIPAWGNAPGNGRKHISRAESPIYTSLYVLRTSPTVSSCITSTASSSSIRCSATSRARKTESTRRATSWRAGIDRKARVSSLNPTVL